MPIFKYFTILFLSAWWETGELRREPTTTTLCLQSQVWPYNQTTILWHYRHHSVFETNIWGEQMGSLLIICSKEFVAHVIWQEQPIRAKQTMPNMTNPWNVVVSDYVTFAIKGISLKEATKCIRNDFWFWQVRVSFSMHFVVCPMISILKFLYLCYNEDVSGTCKMITLAILFKGYKLILMVYLWNKCRI